MKLLGIVQLLFAVLFLCLGAFMAADSVWCFRNGPTCGLIEPIIAAYSFPIGLLLGFSGALHLRRRHGAAFTAFAFAVVAFIHLFGRGMWW